MAKKVKRKIAGVLLALFLCTVVAFFVLIRMPFFQTWVTHQVTKIVSEQIGHKVSIEKVSLSFFSHLTLDKVYVEDDHHDTLIYAGRLDGSINNFSYFKKTITIRKLEVQDLRVNIIRDAKRNMNMDGISAALKGNTKKNAGATDTVAPSSKSWQFNFDQLVLNKLHLIYNDIAAHGKLSVDVPFADISVNKIDNKNKLLDLEYAHIKSPDILYERPVFEKDNRPDSSHNIHFLSNLLLIYHDLSVMPASDTLIITALRIRSGWIIFTWISPKFSSMFRMGRLIMTPFLGILKTLPVMKNVASTY